MTKSLEALETFKELTISDGYTTFDGVFHPSGKSKVYSEAYAIIEKELKDYEQLQEDYEILKESYDTQSFNKAIIDNLRTLNDKLQKVLGIIKSKYVDLWLLSHFKSWNAYQNAHMNCSKTPLTKEEYETIQRWFYDR